MSLEKCGRAVFETVSPTDDFDTIKNGITLVANCCSNFPVYQAFSGIIKAYSKPIVTLANSELWYIQNHGIFKTRGIFRTLVYPKLWHIQNQRHIHNPGLFRTLGYSEIEAYSVPC